MTIQPGVLDRATESDVSSLVRTISLAFAGTPEGVVDWLKLGGIENIRIMRLAPSSHAGCFLRIPMGQYFGGRSVPMVGIAGVAVPPESRGQGVARAMMNECVREIARDGVALSCLYASTQALYRQSGYEQAGHRFAIRIPIARLAGVGKARLVRGLGDDDGNDVRACYARFASRISGMLDRGPYIWSRVRKLRDSTYHGFGIGEPGRLTGYLFLCQVRDPASGRHDVHLSDLVFDSDDDGRQLVSFLADFEPMGSDVILYGGPLHPIQTLLPQQRYKVELKDYWMLRIADVRRAIQARGYCEGIDATFNVEIADSVIPENAGMWKVRVRDGQGEIERGSARGAPTLRCSIGAFATMYSGMNTPSIARMLGHVHGDDRAISIAGAIFGTSAPWMSDMF